MGLWENSFRKAFVAAAVLLLVLAAFLVLVSQGNEKAQDVALGERENEFHGDENREKSPGSGFSLHDVSAGWVHESEGYSLHGLNVEISGKEPP